MPSTTPTAGEPLGEEPIVKLTSENLSLCLEHPERACRIYEWKFRKIDERKNFCFRGMLVSLLIAVIVGVRAFDTIGALGFWALVLGSFILWAGPIERLMTSESLLGLQSLQISSSAIRLSEQCILQLNDIVLVRLYRSHRQVANHYTPIKSLGRGKVLEHVYMREENYVDRLGIVTGNSEVFLRDIYDVSLEKIAELVARRVGSLKGIADPSALVEIVDPGR